MLRNRKRSFTNSFARHWMQRERPNRRLNSALRSMCSGHVKRIGVRALVDTTYATGRGCERKGHAAIERVLVLSSK